MTPAAQATIFVAIAAFALSMLVPAAFPNQTQLLGLPLFMVAALWMVPLGMALVRGEKWAFILALAVLIFVTDSSFRTRHWTDKTLDWQALLKGLIWMGVGMIGLMRLSRTARLFSTPPVLFTLAFVAMLGMSALWSKMPLYSLQSAMSYFWLLLFGLAAAEVLDETAFLKAIALGCGMVVLPSLAVAPFGTGIVPPSPGSTGESDRLRGIADHPIPLAEEAALFTFACAALMRRLKGSGLRIMLALMVVAGIITVLLTQSRIPPIAMIAAVLSFAAYRKGGWLLMVPSLLLCVTVVLLMESMAGFAALLPQGMLEMFARSGSSSEILTLSGRLDIWPYVLDMVGRAPLLGHGHASGMVLFDGFTKWSINHAHNAYLQSLLYVGVAGTALLAMALLSQLRIFLVRPSAVRDIVFLYMLLKGMTEQSILSNMPSGAVVLWMITVGMAAMAWRQRRAPVSGAFGMNNVPGSPSAAAAKGAR